MTQTEEKGRLPKVGDEIAADEKKFKLVKALGEGGYGSVFESADGERMVAVKTEKYSSSQLHIEVNVLKSANAAKCKHFCDLITYGSMKPDYVFMVMTLLHKDLHKLRSEMNDRKFSFSTAIRIGIQSLKAIEELHRVGFISRDIKPGNFAPGHKKNRQAKTIFMYDFGLARRYMDKNGTVFPSRKEVGWRGTTRYGSVNAHARLDLGRRDDIESWFYMLVEMTRGTLPWRLITDRAAVLTNKQASRAGGRTQFLFETPKQYDVIFTYVDELKFEQQPDYEKLHKLLDEAREERNVAKSEHWDWEDETNSTTTNTLSSYSDKECRAKHEGEEKENTKPAQ